jgi:hypothetical protein
MSRATVFGRVKRNQPAITEAAAAATLLPALRLHTSLKNSTPPQAALTPPNH